MNIISVIYFNLLLAVYVSGLLCFQCSFDKNKDTCSDLSAVSTAPCDKDGVCYKALLYQEDDKRPTPDVGNGRPKVFRGCRKRNLTLEDNGCGFQKFKPHDSWICDCSDKDYCNGVENFRNENVFISRHLVLVISALIVSWFSCSIWL